MRSFPEIHAKDFLHDLYVTDRKVRCQNYQKTKEALSRLFLQKYRSLVPNLFQTSVETVINIIQKALMADLYDHRNHGSVPQQLRHMLTSPDLKTRELLFPSHMYEFYHYQLGFNRTNIETYIHIICSSLVRFLLHNLAYSSISPILKKSFQKQKFLFPRRREFTSYQTFPTQVPVGQLSFLIDFCHLAKTFYKHLLFDHLQIDIQGKRVDNSFQHTDQSSNTFVKVKTKHSSHNHAVAVAMVRTPTFTLFAYADQYGDSPGITFFLGNDLSIFSLPRSSSTQSQMLPLSSPLRCPSVDQIYGEGIHWIWGQQGKNLLVFDENDLQSSSSSLTKPIQIRFPTTSSQGTHQRQNKYLQKDQLIKIPKQHVPEYGQPPIFQQVQKILFDVNQTLTNFQKVVAPIVQHLETFHIPLPKQTTQTTCEYHSFENLARLSLLCQQLVHRNPQRLTPEIIETQCRHVLQRVQSTIDSIFHQLWNYEKSQLPLSTYHRPPPPLLTKAQQQLLQELKWIPGLMSLNTLKKEYYKWSRKWHPDYTSDPSSHQKMKLLNSLYQKLSSSFP